MFDKNSESKEVPEIKPKTEEVEAVETEDLESPAEESVEESKEETLAEEPIQPEDSEREEPVPELNSEEVLMNHETRIQALEAAFFRMKNSI